MCARYTLTKDLSILEAILAFVSRIGVFVPRYNIAPRQMAPVLVAENGRPVLKMMRWGIMPPWAEPDGRPRELINARAETVHVKPAFRRLLDRQRCLVPADGFYEWKRDGTRAIPYYFSRNDAALFCFAGLWDQDHTSASRDLFENSSGETAQPGGPPTSERFLILTTAANEVVRPVHDRMPVILPPDQYAAWLAQDKLTPGALPQWLKPLPPDVLGCRRVSSYVNNPRHEGPACLAPD